MYKTPYKNAKQLIENIDLRHLEKCIMNGIKKFNLEHPIYTKDLNSSLSKRILFSIKDQYTRLLTDKIIINWLSENRIDLNNINGSLRKSLSELILKERKENENQNRI